MGFSLNQLIPFSVGNLSNQFEKLPMSPHRFTGIVTPVLTPFNHDGSIAEELYFEHCQHVLEEGSEYISQFGTSGEALTLSTTEPSSDEKSQMSASSPFKTLGRVRRTAASARVKIN